MIPVGLLLMAACNPKTIEVCLSPGCKADGAEATLARLCALSPPHVTVSEGGCESLCGKGPIVIQKETKPKNKKIVHTRVQSDNLSKLLFSLEEDNDSRTTPDLAKSYDMVRAAVTAMIANDNDHAITLFRDGLTLALPHAMALQKNRDDFCTTDETKPSRLQWLVVAHRQYARVLVQQGGDEENFLAASRVAEHSVELSRFLDAESYETVAEVCRAQTDGVGERDALRRVFELEPEGVTQGIAFNVVNRRRELGFRLAKLEREIE